MRYIITTQACKLFQSSVITRLDGVTKIRYNSLTDISHVMFVGLHHKGVFLSQLVIVVPIRLRLAKAEKLIFKKYES